MAEIPKLLLSVLSQCEEGKNSLERVLEGDVCESWSVTEVVDCCRQCLYWFVQLNWTGPPTKDIQTALEGVLSQEGLKLLNQQALAALSIDGEDAYRLCSLPVLLQVSCTLLWSSRAGSSQDNSLLVKRLAMRSQFVRQQLLNHRCSSLWSMLSGLIEDLALMAPAQLTQEEQSELYLELGHVCLYYLQYDLAKLHFDKAADLLAISTKLSGVLGKRTRFQESDVAQLVLQVTSSPSPHPAAEGEGGGAGICLPKEVQMDDETVLDRVDFKDAHPSVYLSALQQATLLGSCIHQRKTKAVDALTEEEMEAYLTCVLRDPQCWSVQAHSLFLKAGLGRQQHRYQQRNMSQLEELVTSFHHLDPDADFRHKLFFCVPVQPVWVVEKELATVLIQLGCLSSAAEVLTRLEMWEELALCYQGVGRKAQAREVVQRQLDTNPTPSLLCLMGDIAQDADYYRQAWELSSSTSARAQRSLGLWYLRREDYAESIECFEKSLSINSLQEGLWFSLGCAASQVGDTQLSIKAWHRAVTLQPDFAEAWNNLAGAHLKNKDKKRAHRIFHEALRCSYHDQKIWENYLLVSADLKLWSDCLRAYHMLCQLDNKFLDVEILSLLVQGCVEETNSTSSSTRDSLGQLLGRIAARGKVEAAVWKLYADFHFSSSLPADHVKGVEDLQKAQRAARLQAGWDKQLEGVASVSNLTLDYSKACRKLYGDDDSGCGQFERKQAIAMLSSAKLALQGVTSKAKEFGLSSVPEIEEILADLNTELKTVVDCISHHTTTNHTTLTTS